MELAALIVALATGVGALGVIEWRERPDRRGTQTAELRFGSDMKAEAVAAVLAGISGLPRRSVVAFDVIASAEGVRHRVHADQATLDTLGGQWRGVVPSLRVDPVAAERQAWSSGVVLRLAGAHSVLRADAVMEAAAAMLGALQPLGSGERLMLRWVLRPATVPRLSHPDPGRASQGWFGFGSAERLGREHRRAAITKYAGPVLAGVGIVAVSAGHPKRAAHLLSRVVSVARSRRSGHGSFRFQRIGTRRLEQMLERGTRIGDRYAPGELAGLLGWPIGAPQVPGLALGASPALLPSPRIPAAGRVLAASTWPGSSRVLAQPVVGGMSHTLIVGPTGVGKSALIASLVAQDLEAGRGCLVLDGKGDLVEDVLARVPAERSEDVIVLEPGRQGPVPGLRVFGRGNDPELTADLILGIFADLFASSWGPLSSRWLRAALVALAYDPKATLADLPFVFSDERFRRRLVARVDDPLLMATWASFEAMGSQERAHQLAAPLNKIEEVIGRRVVRGVLAQPKPALDLSEALRRGRVVLVALSAGAIGGPAARLLGALLIFKLFEAVQGRAAVPAAQRRPFLAYVDEPKVLGDIPVPLDSLFELARGLGVGLTLAGQSLTQLPADLRSAALTNAASLIAFRQSADDARLLSRELPGVTPEALQNLAAFEVVARIGIGPGDVAAPATGRTFPPTARTSDPEQVRQASVARYGVDPAAVDAALRARHTMQADDERPVGQIRRPS